MTSQNRAIALGVLGAAIALGLGVIIGYFSRGESSPTVEPPKADPSASKNILDGISTSNIEKNLRILTENPHFAGREVDEKTLVDFVAKSFSDSGLTVEIHPYDIFLSYPDQNDSNFLAIKKADGTLVNKSHPTEAILDQSQNKSGVVNPFNAYAKSGDPEGELVYVNYGTIEDFIFINENLNISLEGKICIARYGRIFRGDKSLHAEQYNCSGLILYSDPADYAVAGEGVYPNTWYLPGTGAQRGTLFKKNGDPLTIHYPSIDTAWRLDVGDAPLPQIPVTPIGYDDAIMYLSVMGGDEVQDGWKGKLNITYKYGPGFIGEHKTSLMRMHVTTKNERVISHNVIGYIKGFEEPDRYVMIGNHRDAWVFGAMDPSSGTAALLEIARSMGAAVKNGWRPRRSIVFCNWGAEEYGLIGSTEWVEEFQKVLGFRSVAYLNADVMVNGDYSLIIRGSPSLKKVTFDGAKLVPNPNPQEVNAGRSTAYDTWKHVSGGKDEEPIMRTVGSGSDYTMFLQLTGIAVLDFGYDFDPTLGISGYPVYHSVYETFDLVKKFVDPEFKYHQAVARAIAEITRNLADSPILPFNAEDYAAKMTGDMNTMLDKYGQDLTDNGMNTDTLRAAMTNFTNTAKTFHQRIQDVDMTNALELRAINDQLMQLERAFIDKEGIQGRDQFSHIIYAPSLHNTYGGAAFPGLVDSMFEIDKADDQEARWNEVRRQFSILLYHLGSAASTLEDFVSIKGYSNR